ncbi:MAG: ATP-binding cassette domain-containing protein [Bacteroidetes bacterium]|nr:ATP-binding cassette domain-containing protein [Bacteroidota bacterium]
MDNSNVISIHAADFFNENNLILNQIDLELRKGEFAYLIGKTGGGKSTFLKTLYGELKLQEGSGEVAGFDLRKLKRSQVPKLRRKLGIVFQDFQLLTDRNVMDNLLFVLSATGWKDATKMKNRAREVLDLVGLSTKDYKMPHQLSGGEQQRLVIARAILNSPELILADEPTGNLDPDLSEDIVKLLMEISKEENASVLMATHDFVLLEKFPAKVFKINLGKIESLEDSRGVRL